MSAVHFYQLISIDHITYKSAKRVETKEACSILMRLKIKKTAELYIPSILRSARFVQNLDWSLYINAYMFTNSLANCLALIDSVANIILILIDFGNMHEMRILHV